MQTIDEIFPTIKLFMTLGRDEDPVLAKNRIGGSVPQTKGDFFKDY